MQCSRIEVRPIRPDKRVNLGIQRDLLKQLQVLERTMHLAHERKPEINLPGQAVVEVSGSTIQSALDDLGKKYDGITQRVFENGQIRRFVNVYLNDEDIRYLDNLATPVKDGDELSIIPAVAGG